MTDTDGKLAKRDDPRYDARRLIAFFLGLVVFYAAVVAAVQPGEGDISKVALGLMFAPTVGAIAAVVFAHGRIRFGRATKHILLAFLPPTVILLTTWLAALAADVPAILSSSALRRSAASFAPMSSPWS